MQKSKVFLTLILAANLLFSPLLVSAASLSPKDADAQELLQSLGVQLEDTDPLWQDGNFIAFVNKYKEIKQNGVKLMQDAGDLALQTFDLVDLGAQVQHPQFQEAFTLSLEEQAQIEEARQYIIKMQEDPEAFLNGLMQDYQGSMPTSMDTHRDTGLGYSVPLAYGYTDALSPVEAGRVVWLYDGTPSEAGIPMETTWTQVTGPEVQWLKTTESYNRAFIVPSLADYDEDYLSFEMKVEYDYLATPSTYTVHVPVKRPAQTVASVDPITQLYQQVLQRNPDNSGLRYWTEKHKNGMTLDQVRAEFQKSDEYKKLK